MARDLDSHIRFVPEFVVLAENVRRSIPDLGVFGIYHGHQNVVDFVPNMDQKTKRKLVIDPLRIWLHQQEYHHR